MYNVIPDQPQYVADLSALLLCIIVLVHQYFIVLL